MFYKVKMNITRHYDGEKHFMQSERVWKKSGLKPCPNKESILQRFTRPLKPIQLTPAQHQPAKTCSKKLCSPHHGLQQFECCLVREHNFNSNRVHYTQLSMWNVRAHANFPALYLHNTLLMLEGERAQLISAGIMYGLSTAIKNNFYGHIGVAAHMWTRGKKIIKGNCSPPSFHRLLCAINVEHQNGVRNEISHFIIQQRKQTIVESDSPSPRSNAS